MRKLFIGIDPGLTGAVAVIDEIDEEGISAPTVSLYDILSFEVSGTKKTKSGKIRIHREYDYGGVHKIFTSIISRIRMNGITIDRDLIAGLEWSQAMPDQGVVGMFKTGEGFGMFKMILTTLSIPFEVIRPVLWKKFMMAGMGKEKDASIIKAQQLFPYADISKKRDHNRADALLIAEYMRRHHQEKKG
jgi:crossover junction endodeoxyribonuclease RuvC